MELPRFVFGGGEIDKGCRYDEKLDKVIHCFQAGKRRCKCGGRVVRHQVKRLKLKFGRQAHDPDYQE